MGDSSGTITLELIDQPYGRCRAILTEDNGAVMLDRIYKNRNSAQASVRTRLKKDGLGVDSITRIDPNEAQDDTEVHASDDMPHTGEPEVPAPAPASPADRWLSKLRLEADKVLSEAVRLRERADQLETEHKRLTAAADVLEGPDGGIT
jgi:hypothetical protein